MGELVRHRVNANFGRNRQGEIVMVDPVAWASYIEGGYLSPVEDPEDVTVELDQDDDEELLLGDRPPLARED